MKEIISNTEIKYFRRRLALKVRDAIGKFPVDELRWTKLMWEVWKKEFVADKQRQKH